MIHRVPKLIEFVRHSHGDIDMGQTALRIQKLYPDLVTRLPDGSLLEHIISQCAEDLGNDLRAFGQEPDQFLLGPQGSALLRSRVLLHVSELGYAPGTIDAATWQTARAAEYRRLFDRVTLGLPGANTATTTRASDSAQSHPDQTYRSPLREM